MMIREKDIIGLYIVKKSPYQRPQFYTNHEGGNWIDWPNNAEFNYEWLKLRSNRGTVRMGEIRVHSVSFGNPLDGFDRIQRWDCINGFDSFVFYPNW